MYTGWSCLYPGCGSLHLFGCRLSLGDGLAAKEILAAEFLSTSLSKERFWLGPVKQTTVSTIDKLGGFLKAISVLLLLLRQGTCCLLADVLVAEGVNLGRARAHDVVRGRDVLLGTSDDVRFLGHFALKDLAVVVHALDILGLLGVAGGLLRLLHGGVDVLFAENVGRHGE
ncbi:hypothetical protein IF2G_09731 [Cordyceps javanica]|nr:hypothetical protein IF2G_09731 [Cordyceps javanica]